MKSSEAASLRCAGGGGAQRPVWGGSELKKTGARSAQARTRGQNPLVKNICVEIRIYTYKLKLFIFEKKVEFYRVTQSL